MIPSQNRQYTQDERYRKIKARVTKFNKMNVGDDYNTQTKDLIGEQGQVSLDIINKDIQNLIAQYETLGSNFTNILQLAGGNPDPNFIAQLLLEYTNDNKNIQNKINLLIQNIKNINPMIPFLPKNSKIVTIQLIDNLLQSINISFSIVAPFLSVRARNLPQNVEYFFRQYAIFSDKLIDELNKFKKLLNTSIFGVPNQ